MLTRSYHGFIFPRAGRTALSRQYSMQSHWPTTCQWRISNFDPKTKAWTDLPWMAGCPTLPRHEGPAHTPRPSADHYRQAPGTRRCKGHRRRQPADEAADPHHESRPATRAESNRCGSLPARVLVTFPQSAPYPACRRDSPAFDAADIPPPAQAAQVPTAIFC